MITPPAQSQVLVFIWRFLTVGVSLGLMNELIGQLQQRNGKIMAIENENEAVKVTFATSTGDVFFGSVGRDFEGLEGLETNDIAYMEYFEYPHRAKVEFEIINKMDRAAIRSTEIFKNDAEREFFIRREQALKTDIGYKALFVDSDRTGLPTTAFFLMEDDSLAVIKYTRTEQADEPEKFSSAREYLKYNEWKLKRAGEFDAIKQLSDYIDASC